LLIDIIVKQQKWFFPLKGCDEDEEDSVKFKSEPEDDFNENFDLENAEYRKCSFCHQLYEGLLIKHLKSEGCRDREETLKSRKTKKRIKDKTCAHCGKTSKGLVSFRRHLKKSLECNEVYIESKSKVKDCENNFHDFDQHIGESDDHSSDKKSNLKKGPKFKKKTCDTCNQVINTMNNTEGAV
jgi:hypothetical protein